MSRETFTAVVVAAGKGSRMKSSVRKQFMELLGKPLVYYPLAAFQKSRVDEIILVTEEDAINYCRKEIVEKYGLSKVTKIIPGGKERYQSVYEAIKETGSDYILIQDGARPFLDQEIILRSMEGVKTHKACVIGMPVKDTIKIVDDRDEAVETPDRAYLWQMQTPQCFITEDIRKAYEAMLKTDQKGITEDAMVMEQYGDTRIKLLRGSYENIKITTPEDMIVGEALMKERLKEADFSE